MSQQEELLDCQQMKLMPAHGALQTLLVEVSSTADYACFMFHTKYVATIKGTHTTVFQYTQRYSVPRTLESI